MPEEIDKKKWFANYGETHELLERMRARELAAMKDEEALRMIKMLVPFSPPWRQRSDWSGLVEQQALFHRKKR